MAAATPARRAFLQLMTAVAAVHISAIALYYGLRVNAVFPGPIWGTSLQGYLDSQAAERGVAPQVVYDEFASKNAMRALIPPEDIADSVVFLASDMARPITGQALYANAGESFH